MQGGFGIHGGVFATVSDILKPLAFGCATTAIELLLQAAAALSAFEGACTLHTLPQSPRSAPRLSRLWLHSCLLAGVGSHGAYWGSWAHVQHRCGGEGGC